MRPPNRSLVTRVETFIGLLMAGALAVLVTAGAGSSDYGENLSELTTGVPGSAAISLILGIVILNGLFTAAGTAVDLLKPLHIKHFRDEDNERRAGRLQRLFDHRQTYSAACILGSHICRVAMILAGLLLAPAIAHQLQPEQEPSFTLIIESAIIVSIPILILNLIVELVPKSFASLHPARSSLRLYSFITGFAIVFSPLAKLVTAIGGLITARFGAKASFTIENQAEEEIKSIVEDAEVSGQIEADEKELLHSVFEFTDTIAREVMTPRTDMDSLPASSEPEEVARVIEETGHSRIPLYEETDDQIVGIVHAKDLLNAIRHSNGKKVSLKSLMRSALFVPETMNLTQLLTELRVNKSQMAIVQDEFGGTAGVVTNEDIVEELVGEIVDEYDEEEPEIVEQDGSYLVDGKTHVDDVSDQLGVEIDSEEFDTIGGYVFGLFGRQPKIGESIVAEGFSFTVADTDGRRIVRLKIDRVCPEDEKTHYALPEEG
jgi:putative hemolysin